MASPVYTQSYVDGLKAYYENELQKAKQTRSGPTSFKKCFIIAGLIFLLWFIADNTDFAGGIIRLGMEASQEPIVLFILVLIVVLVVFALWQLITSFLIPALIIAAIVTALLLTYYSLSTRPKTAYIPDLQSSKQER